MRKEKSNCSKMSEKKMMKEVKKPMHKGQKEKEMVKEKMRKR